jgi:hypothetical protein
MVTVEKVVESKVTRIYRFDVFKGRVDANGKIHKVRSVGVAYHGDGQGSFRLYLKTFLKDDFFLLPDRESGEVGLYSITTRMPSTFPGKKYFWHTVGTGKVLSGENAGFMHLSWDLLGGSDIYLNLYPKDSYEPGPENQAAGPMSTPTSINGT